MKIYVSDNHDGINQAMVVAATLAEAARRFGTTAYSLRLYGWHRATPEEERACMAACHNEVLYKPIDARGDETLWRRTRWRSDEAREALQATRRNRR